LCTTIIGGELERTASRKTYAVIRSAEVTLPRDTYGMANTWFPSVEKHHTQVPLLQECHLALQ
jgi:hypothetical protein